MLQMKNGKSEELGPIEYQWKSMFSSTSLSLLIENNPSQYQPNQRIWKCFMLRLGIIESYMDGKKNQIQLPYFIVEKTEACSIHFNWDLFSKQHSCPWVIYSSFIIYFHAVLLTTTQNTSVLTMPCVWIWSFLHVSLERTVWSLWGIFPCGIKARSSRFSFEHFLREHYHVTSGARKKSLWYIFYRYFLLGFFSSKRKAFVNISHKAYVN